MMLRCFNPARRFISLGSCFESSHSLTQRIVHINMQRRYCVAKFGLGPRFEEYKPNPPGDPLDMGEETEAEYEEKLKELSPDRVYDDPDKALEIYQDNLNYPTKLGQVIKLEDERLPTYTPEAFFGIKNEDLTQITDIVSGRVSGKLPDIKTIRRLDRKSFIRLLTLQSRNNLPDLAFRSMKIMRDLRMDIDTQVYTLVISSCYKQENIPRARELFDNMLMDGVPLTVQCCTAMMSCYAKNLQLDEAYKLMKTYALGPDRIIEPDNAIFTTLIQGCVRKKNFQLAWDTFDMMRQFYLEGDSISFTTMINVCAYQYEAERAFNLFDEMKFLNLPLLDTTFQAMLKVCANRFDYFHKAFEIVKEMKVHGYTPDRQTYHSLLAACGPAKNLKAADMIINQMDKENIHIDTHTYAIMLDVIGRTMYHANNIQVKKSLVTRADLIFEQLQKFVKDRKTKIGESALISGDKITNRVLNSYVKVYTEALYLRKAEELLKLYPELGLTPDIQTYTMFLKMFSRAKRVEACFDIYRQIKQHDLVPDTFAWRHLLNVCARTQYYNNGFKILKLMIAKDYEITPKHIHLFYRALASNKLPQLEELKELVWPYPKCRVFFLRPPPAYPTHPEPPTRVRPGEIKRKLKGKRWKKKASNRKNKPKSK